jgi:hypothetical protein
MGVDEQLMRVDSFRGWTAQGQHLPDVIPAPLNYNNGVLSNHIVVPGRVVVYGYTVYNTKGTAQYVNVFDANTLPADNAVPLWSFNIGANAVLGFAFFSGRQFQGGLVLCNSSTDTKKTIGSADCFFDVQFDVYSYQNAPGTGE